MGTLRLAQGRCQLAVATVAALLVLLLSPCAALADEAEETAAIVEAHLRAADKAAREMRLADALNHSLDAWKLEQAYDTACNIGRLYVRLGDKLRAAEFLSKCRALAPPPEGSDEWRQAMEQEELQRVEKEVGAGDDEVGRAGGDRSDPRRQRGAAAP